MLFERKEIQLKDGRTALFRSPEGEDALEMLQYLRDCSSETEFVVRYPEECPVAAEQEVAFLEGVNRSPDNVMIVCIVDGKIAGNCHLAFHGRMKTKHRGNVAIALRKKYWNLGIGQAMFREMIAIAEKQGISQLELAYIEGNERAKHLYEKMGFVQVAEHPDAFRLKDGTLRKEIFMMRKL